MAGDPEAPARFPCSRNADSEAFASRSTASMASACIGLFRSLPMDVSMPDDAPGAFDYQAGIPLSAFVASSILKLRTGVAILC